LKPYYQDEAVTIYHGDALEILPDLEADVLVTDPPYGMKHTPRGTYDAKTGKTGKGQRGVAGDESVVVRDEVLAWWGEDRPAAVFGTWRLPRPSGVNHRLIWWKQGAPPGPARTSFMLQDEEIYILGKGWVESSPPLRSVIPTSEPRQGAFGEAARIGHPTPKPLALMRTLVERTPPGVILDPFMGSGSTLRAAKDLGRKAIGIELEERYCEIAAQRCAQDVLDLGMAA
jgi:DNA modification methylase